MAAIALLLGKLPPFSNRRLLIEGKQSVNDIIREVLTAHRIFATDYDSIAADFWQGTVYGTCEYLFNFCKRSIGYKVEREENQTTKSPAAILTQATGDCKHYAGFIGGILDALIRQGKKINFVYRFAAYSGNDAVPEHVFIVVKDKGQSIWIDPVLKTFNEKLQPSYYTDKKINMLTRVSGIGDISRNYIVSDVLNSVDFNSNPVLYLSVQKLLKYGILNADAKVNNAALARYKKQPALYNDLAAALNVTRQNAIGGFFDKIVRAVKVVSGAGPRAAYIALVGLNAFGYATKLKHAIYNPNGTFTEHKDKIKHLWQDKLGGQFAVLLSAVNGGYGKRAILGNPVIVIPAWVAAATAVITAITPIVTAALKSKQTAAGGTFDTSTIDPVTGLPYGSPNLSTSGGGPIEWIKNNPIIVAGGLAAVYFLTRKKKTA